MGKYIRSEISYNRAHGKTASVRTNISSLSKLKGFPSGSSWRRMLIRGWEGSMGLERLRRVRRRSLIVWSIRWSRHRWSVGQGIRVREEQGWRKEIKICLCRWLNLGRRSQGQIRKRNCHTRLLGPWLKMWCAISILSKELKKSMRRKMIQCIAGNLWESQVLTVSANLTLNPKTTKKPKSWKSKISRNNLYANTLNQIDDAGWLKVLNQAVWRDCAEDVRWRDEENRRRRREKRIGNSGLDR